MNPVNCTVAEATAFIHALKDGYLCEPSIFSQEAAADYWPTSCSATPPSPPSRLMVIAAKTFKVGNKTEYYPGSQFTMTLRPSTEPRGAEPWTASAAAFPVKTSVWPGKAQGLTAQEADSGRSMPGLLAKYDPATHSLRIPQGSLFSDSTECLATLPRSGTMRNGRVYQRPPLEPSIGETEFGFWPTQTVNGNHNRKGLSAKSGDGLATAVKSQLYATPTTMDALPPKSAKALHREATQARPGRRNPANLRDQVMNSDNWPTPGTRGFNNDGDLMALARMADDQDEYDAMAYRAAKSKKDKFYPTPCATPGTSDLNWQATDGRTKPNKLGWAVAEQLFPTPVASDRRRGSPRQGHTPKLNKATLRLNPAWVELLMGWPSGWTDNEATPDMDYLFTAQQQWRDGTWEQNIPRAVAVDIDADLKPLAFLAFMFFVSHVSDGNQTIQQLVGMVAKTIKFEPRLKSIGNGQVPQAAAAAFPLLLERINGR